MIITIREHEDSHYINLNSKDKRFHEAWGSVVKIPVSAVYQDLSQISYWCNNTLNEECLFEVD